jgi:hypothetical protein
MARDAVKKAGQAQSQAVGMAGEISGEQTLVAVAGLEWHAPATWQKQPPANKMRAAQFQVAPDGGSGEAMVVFSTGIGGDARQNIERWRQQVVDPASGQPAAAEIKTSKIAGCTVTTCVMQGTLVGGQMGGPAVDRADSGFRGAIIEGPSGAVFIKFTGPADIVSANDAAWNDLLNGMRKP